MATRPVRNHDHRQGKLHHTNGDLLACTPSPGSRHTVAQHHTGLKKLNEKSDSCPTITPQRHLHSRPTFTSLRHNHLFSEVFLSERWVVKEELDSTCHSVECSCPTVHTTSVTICLSQKDGHSQTWTGKNPAWGWSMSWSKLP